MEEIIGLRGKLGLCTYKFYIKHVEALSSLSSNQCYQHDSLKCQKRQW